MASGNPATLAVIRGPVRSDSIRSMLVVAPQDLIAVLVDGTLVAAHGQPIRGAGDGLDGDHPHLGAWRDPVRDMIQYLRPNDSYTESGSGRRNAYTGRSWLDGERITYCDDAGFYAFGQFHRGTLHHAGFVLHKD